jgi:hypothetical protein
MNKPVLPVVAVAEIAERRSFIETCRLAASRTFPSKLEGTLNRVAFPRPMWWLIRCRCQVAHLGC